MEEEKDYKQVLVLRKDLNMRKGKMIAQGCHAGMEAVLSMAEETDEGWLIRRDDRIWPWRSNGKYKKIAVSVNSETELKEIYEKAKSLGLICKLILDSGLTEFGSVPTYTAVAVGPGLSAEIDEVTGGLPLL